MESFPLLVSLSCIIAENLDEIDLPYPFPLLVTPFNQYLTYVRFFSPGLLLILLLLYLSPASVPLFFSGRSIPFTFSQR